MISSSLRTLGITCMVLLLIGAAAAMHGVRDRRYSSAAGEEGSLYLTSGPGLRLLTTGYNALASDVYWIRTVQYYGSIRLRLTNPDLQQNAVGPAPTNYDLLYPLLDATTTLDPRFNIAFRFGAIFLAEPFPGGAGRPDLGIALLEKGLRERPDKWEYMQDIGFIHYWWRSDYRAAADWFERAGQVEGAPWWLTSLAATTLLEGGDRQTSRTIWQALRDSATDNEWLRRDAERRLLQLAALDQMDALQQIVDSYADTAGNPPADWLPLVRARLVRGIPVDPAGVPYEIDNGRVQLARRSSLWPLPTEPKRMVAPVS